MGSNPKRVRAEAILVKIEKRVSFRVGLQYCHRCHEECGVIVNAYILRDIAAESGANESSHVGQPEPEDA